MQGLCLLLQLQPHWLARGDLLRLSAVNIPVCRELWGFRREQQDRFFDEWYELSLPWPARTLSSSSSEQSSQ